MKYASKILFVATCILIGALSAQAQTIDKIVAVVGNEIVLYSDIQIQKKQLESQGYPKDADDCDILEDLLFEKLLLNQAKVDSIEVSDGQVELELAKRIEVFVKQIGSVEALEEYYGKSMEEIREDFHDVLRDQMLVRQMQQKVTENVNVTPADVEQFYEAIPADSLPYINASVELAQIVKYPEVPREETERIRARLREFKEEVESGKQDFETLAALYSDDPGSAAKGGNLGMKPRGTWVPEFDAAAYSLKEGEISAPFKTDFGYHILQLVEMRGEMYNANHILLLPKISSVSLTQAKTSLDSIRALVAADTLSFALAANKYSDDERTKNQNGTLVNMKTGSTMFEMDELDPTMFLAIDSLKPGQITQPFYFQNAANQKKGYRIVKLTKRTKPHRANPVDDYSYLQDAASQSIRSKETDRWVRQKIGNSYIRIADDYLDCDFKFPWRENASAKAGPEQ